MSKVMGLLRKALGVESASSVSPETIQALLKDKTALNFLDEQRPALAVLVDLLFQTGQKDSIFLFRESDKEELLQLLSLQSDPNNLEALKAYLTQKIQNPLDSTATMNSSAYYDNSNNDCRLLGQRFSCGLNAFAGTSQEVVGYSREKHGRYVYKQYDCYDYVVRFLNRMGLQHERYGNEQTMTANGLLKAAKRQQIPAGTVIGTRGAGYFYTYSRRLGGFVNSRGKIRRRPSDHWGILYYREDGKPMISDFPNPTGAVSLSRFLRTARARRTRVAVVGAQQMANRSDALDVMQEIAMKSFGIPGKIDSTI